jgi:hypothetical protein
MCAIHSISIIKLLPGEKVLCKNLSSSKALHDYHSFSNSSESLSLDAEDRKPTPKILHLEPGSDCFKI